MTKSIVIAGCIFCPVIGLVWYESGLGAGIIALVLFAGIVGFLRYMRGIR
jgi:hypothetical protein